ncbi:MAG TPA: hypothetical protein VKI19_09225, partial [Acidimicrobiales bacterium]|nr:hypothetical protein [Acidimicrobiales bacterium]
VSLSGAVTASLAPTGFRTVRADRSGGRFGLEINGVPVFCRGANWLPLDVTTLQNDPDRLERDLQRFVAAGFNMVRVPGTAVYETEAWWEMCDRLGIMVWQDAMWASMDPPKDEEWQATYAGEVAAMSRRAASHPALTVLSGGSEVEQQSAMLGLDPAKWSPPLLAELAGVVAAAAPGVPYVPTTPTGGVLPFAPGEGVAHYFGVGTYRRPLSDVRDARVSFAAECLAFSVPPEPDAVKELGGAIRAGHHPGWKAGVPGQVRSFDDEEVREAYVRDIFGIDPVALRATDPARALDYGRAAVAEAFTSNFAFWRRARSGCHGALVLHWRDVVPGPGWGLLDWRGRPKVTWYVVRRLLDPVAVWLADDGLNGLMVALANDSGTEVQGDLEVAGISAGGQILDAGSQAVLLGPRQRTEILADRVLGGFRDLSWAFRFGPPTYDAVVAQLTLRAGNGTDRILRAVHFPAGPARPRLPDLGLAGRAIPAGPGEWELEVTSTLPAQWVAVDCPGFAVSDSWFHVVPGYPERIRLVLAEAGGGGGRPVGAVHALNGHGPAPIAVQP